jgi:hypothetical protein
MPQSRPSQARAVEENFRVLLLLPSAIGPTKLSPVLGPEANGTGSKESDMFGKKCAPLYKVEDVRKECVGAKPLAGHRLGIQSRSICGSNGKICLTNFVFGFW